MAKGRVLLAHENADCRKIFGSVLAFDGYEVEAVADGESALRFLEALPFDALVTDLYLPSLGDECLVRAVRTHSLLEHLPVVVTTGWTTEPHRRVAIESGADAFLPLPVRPRELLDVVSRVLHQPTAAPPSLDAVNQRRDHPVANGL